MDLFNSVESLSIPGRRLNDTIYNMKGRFYSTVTYPSIKVKETRLRLEADFVKKGPLELLVGELSDLTLCIRNIGRESVNGLWMMTSRDVDISYRENGFDGTLNVHGIGSNTNCV